MLRYMLICIYCSYNGAVCQTELKKNSGFTTILVLKIIPHKYSKN